jgi:hypothetical protein
MQNVCWVLAYKVDGVYVPTEFVHPDISSGLEEAGTLLEEDPSSDPKLIQVVLSASNPLLLEADIRALLEEAKAKAPVHEVDGLQAAITLLENRALLHTDDLEQVADPQAVAEHIIETLENAEDAEEARGGTFIDRWQDDEQDDEQDGSAVKE